MNPNLIDNRSLQSAHWDLFAVIAPGSTKNAGYSFTLEEWTVDDQSHFMIFKRQFSIGCQDEVIYSAVGDLEHILLSLFVNDRIPRKILYFWYPRSLEKEFKVRLLFMLGQTGRDLQPKQADLSGINFFGGWPFSAKKDYDSNDLPSNTLIIEWFELLRSNESIASGLGLLQNSFATINALQGKYRHYDYLDLTAAFILMISGLESILLSQSQDQADISFKFKIVGTAYYNAFVTQDYLSGFTVDRKKLSSGEMIDLLAALYALRSGIAHGRARSLFGRKRIKDWKKIFQILHVKWHDPADKSQFFAHVLLALGMLQPHIFALIWCSKGNLSKGVHIVDELF